MSLEGISNYKDKHAFLAPSQPAWLRYTESHLLEMYRQESAQEKGTKLHEWAENTIRLGIWQKQRTNIMLYNYVNDAIGFGMEPEKLLFHTKYCFGTADSIIFKKGVLRIHDLKTGVTKPHDDQLKVYAALWCLTNGVDPESIKIICRFYQRDVCNEFQPTGEEIRNIMNIILAWEKILEMEDGGGLIL